MVKVFLAYLSLYFSSLNECRFKNESCFCNGNLEMSPLNMLSSNSVCFLVKRRFFSMDYFSYKGIMATNCNFGFRGVSKSYKSINPCFIFIHTALSDSHWSISDFVLHL